MPWEDVSALYSNHHAWLLNWLGQRLQCTQHAADLAHDVFIRVIVAREPCAARQPRAYLRTIASGLVINHWRRREIERAYLQALAERTEPHAASPETHTLVLETLYEIDAMLARLPQKVRSAFLWAQLDGLKYADIAERLGVSERMVKKYMARAMLECLMVAAA